MKLLERKTLTSDFNLQRKMQVDEGVRIAQKVDKLRETLSSLESQQEKFLAGARQELETATGALQRNKANLQGEIRQLEQQRKELLKPLDDEWTKLTEEKSKLKVALLELDSKEHHLNERESQIKKTEKITEQDRRKIFELKEDATRAYESANEDKRVAKDIRSATEANADTQAREFAKTNRELAKRENENINNRKYLDLVKENLDMREKGLDNKERAIADRYATLQRTLERK